MDTYKILKVPIRKQVEVEDRNVPTVHESGEFDRWGYKVQVISPSTREARLAGGTFSKYITYVDVPGGNYTHYVQFPTKKLAQEYVDILQNGGEAK